MKKTLQTALAILMAILAGTVLASSSMLAQEKAGTPPTPGAAKPSATTAATVASSAPQPNEAEMMAQMMELAKTGENHKLLADLAGNWDYKIKFWMVPGMPPTESSGTAVRKSIMDDRFSIMDVAGKVPMPGPDGKMISLDFKGMSVDAYDNVKQKFVSTWIDNMGTGIFMSEGTYDPAAKALTYQSEMELVPGMKTQVREVVKLTDKDHNTLEWYEKRGGEEMKTMEINYTRRK
jgi:hypothetical protein